MDPEDSLSLDHGIPAPETYLPGSPLWFWWLMAAGIFLLLILASFLYRAFRKKTLPPLLPPPHDFYAAAALRLRELEAGCDSRPLSEMAADCSLTIRAYLADSLSEPALYETVEEFKARQVELPREAETLLTSLNDVKYARSAIDPARAREFIEHSKQCLETIHTAQNLKA